MKEKVAQRIKEIEAAIQNTVSNHATLNGHLEEAKWLLKTIFEAECKANPAIAGAEKAVEVAVPAVEAAIPAVETAVHAVEGAVEGKPVTAS